MSDTSRRGGHALLIVGGVILSVVTFAFVFYFEYLDAKPKPINRTATRWANSIADQDAESIRNNDPAYQAPKFPDKPRRMKPMPGQQP